MYDRQFNWSEEVEVSNDKVHWYFGRYVHKNPVNGKYVIAYKTGFTYSYKYCRKKLPYFKVDEKVWTRKNATLSLWHERHFSHYNEKGKPCCFNRGQTSWTTKETTPWDEIRKVEEE